MLLNNQQITEEKKRNKNMHRNEWKWKHNNPKPMGHCKTVLRGRLIAIQAYLKKQEKSQINLHLNKSTSKGRNEEP